MQACDDGLVKIYTRAHSLGIELETCSRLRNPKASTDACTSGRRWRHSVLDVQMISIGLPFFFIRVRRP